MAKEFGFVYVLSNASMPNTYKIGFTTKHPRARIDELSKSTGCPTPFELLTYIGCASPQVVEQRIHRALDQYRLAKNREFFVVDDAIIILEEIASIADYDEFFDDCMGNQADILYSKYIKEKTATRCWKVDYFLSQNADANEMDFRGIGFK